MPWAIAVQQQDSDSLCVAGMHGVEWGLACGWTGGHSTYAHTIVIGQCAGAARQAVVGSGALDRVAQGHIGVQAQVAFTE